MRDAGDLQVIAVAERLGTAVGILGFGMEAALAAGLEETPRKRLRFATSVDWDIPGRGAVRRLLLHAEAEFARQDGVAAVTRRYGFSHLGRFAAAYVRQFGELPRRG